MAGAAGGRLGRAAGVCLVQLRAATPGRGGPGASRRASSHGHAFPPVRTAPGLGAWHLRSPLGCLKTATLTVCHFSTADNSKVSYQELQDLLESKSVFLIDVREKWEIAESGQIPGSISIPLGEVVEALQMNQKHFKERYGHDMPSTTDCVVFSCLAGIRSSQALAVAKSLGFNRAQHYAGGFKEWAEYKSSEKK